MWIYLKNAALSIVQHRDRPDLLLVRSRNKGDISNVFPSAEVLSTPDADYPHRAFISREAVAEALRQQVEAIDYPNFKGSITDDGRLLHYYQVYEATAVNC